MVPESVFPLHNSKTKNDVLFQKVTQAYSEKRNPSAPIRSRTEVLRITSSDALLLSYRGLVGARVIKLGSWDKHPAHGLDLNFERVVYEINVMVYVKPGE